MRMASQYESHETVIDFLVNTQVQSHITLLRRGFGTSVPFINVLFTITTRIWLRARESMNCIP